MSNVELEDLTAVRMQVEGKTFLRLVHVDGTFCWYVHRLSGWERASISRSTPRVEELETMYWNAEARGAL